MRFYKCQSCGIIDRYVGDEPIMGQIVLLNPPVCDKCWELDQMEASNA